MEVKDLSKNCKYCFKKRCWTGSHNPRAYFIGDDLWYFNDYSTKGVNLQKYNDEVLKGSDWIITDIPNPEYRKLKVSIRAIYNEDY